MNTTVLGDLAGQTLGGRYLVGRPLARGGMATVYLATDTRLQRTVAIKVLRSDLSADPDFMDRFRREARATAALSHPHVVAVFDFDAADQLAYLVLEYVPGWTLRHLIASHRLTPSQSLAVLAPILEALVAAHESGIVHRDIKPENVLLGPRGSIKVADFGLARALDDHEHKTRTGLVIGTAAYVSPEHVAGTGSGAASDIYSSGILLFEMLTGQPPFAGENALSVAYQHVNSDVPRPSSRTPGIPTELDELVLGATARDPADRFPSAQAFLDELRRVAALMPVPGPLPDPTPASSDTTVLTGTGAGAGSPSIVDLADRDTGQLPSDTGHDLAPAATIGLLAPSDGAGRPAGAAGPVAEVAPRRRGRGRIALVALLSVGLIAGLAWAFLAGPLQRATVPNIVGLTQQDADALLSDTGLRLKVDDQQYSETAPKDTIISQDPAADAGSFLRFPVSVVLSLGPERYPVPDLRGQSVQDATRSLADTKLTVAGQTTAFDEEVGKGQVAGTDPPVGTSLKPQTGVTLIVSDGPAPRRIPDLLGQPAAAAKAALETAGLVAESSDAFSEQYAAGTVSATDPAAGTEVAKGATVKLTISKGPPPVAVPRVVDMKRQDAISKLQAAGFTVNVQEGVVTPLDRVYSQDPPPGELRPKGSTVTISIF